jgi:hypothetical protein
LWTPDRESGGFPGRADGSEYAAQFDFSRVGGLAFHFADPALSLLSDYGDPCAVDFHVEDGDRRTEWNWQIKLESALDFGLFEPHDFGADLLGLAFYRLSARYRGPNENFVLVASNHVAILRPTSLKSASRLWQMR